MHLFCTGKTIVGKPKVKKGIERRIIVLDFKDEPNCKNKAELTVAKIFEPEKSVFSSYNIGLTSSIEEVTA